MTQALQPAPLSPSIATPDELRELLGPPPVLGSEDDRAYDAIMGRLTQSLAPRDFVEQLLVKEVADCFWEVRRYTRQKTLTMERGFQSTSGFRPMRTSTHTARSKPAKRWSNSPWGQSRSRTRRRSSSTMPVRWAGPSRLTSASTSCWS